MTDLVSKNIKFSLWKAAEDTKEFKRIQKHFVSCHYQSFICIIISTIQIRNLKKTLNFSKYLGSLYRSSWHFDACWKEEGMQCVCDAPDLCTHTNTAQLLNETSRKVKEGQQPFDLLKYQRGMQDGKQRVESRVSSHVCCSEPLNPPHLHLVKAKCGTRLSQGGRNRTRSAAASRLLLSGSCVTFGGRLPTCHLSLHLSQTASAAGIPLQGCLVSSTPKIDQHASPKITH